MNIKLHGQCIDLGQSFQNYMRDGLEPALEKYFDQDRFQDVSVHVNKSGSEFSISIELYVARQKLTASDKGEHAHTAFDGALTKLTKQVRRYKRRLKNHHREAHNKEIGSFMEAM